MLVTQAIDAVAADDRDIDLCGHTPCRTDESGGPVTMTDAPLRRLF